MSLVKANFCLCLFKLRPLFSWEISVSLNIAILNLSCSVKTSLSWAKNYSFKNWMKKAVNKNLTICHSVTCQATPKWPCKSLSSPILQSASHWINPVILIAKDISMVRFLSLSLIWIITWNRAPKNYLPGHLKSLMNGMSACLNTTKVNQKLMLITPSQTTWKSILRCQDSVLKSSMTFA